MIDRSSAGGVRQPASSYDRLNGHARKPAIAARWPLLSIEDIARAGGDRELLAIRIVERYGISRDWAVREVADWAGWNTLRAIS